MVTRLSLLLVLTAPLLLDLPARSAEGADPGTAAEEAVLKEAGVGVDSPALLDFFRKRTVSGADLILLQKQVKQLGDRRFSVREMASVEVVKRGTVALQFLRPAMQSTDPEVARRAADCVRLIEQATNTALPAAAARLLVVRKPDDALPVLLAYLPFADDDRVQEAVRSAITTLAVRDGKPEEVVVKALADEMAVKRAAAGEALARVGGVEVRPAVRKLLRDADPVVRLRVGLALADQQEKEALPVLIALLAELPHNQSWAIEEVLYILAGDAAPKDVLEDDPAARKKCRDAWAAWWDKNGEKTDLAKLTSAVRMLGLTLIIEVEKGGNCMAQELGPDRKVRWKFGNLNNSVDAYVLPGNRLLIAEYGANRVTERNLEGKILWEKPVPGACMAQRLQGGNTFIMTMSQLLEVDRNGKEVFSWKPTNGGLRSGYKYRDGTYGVVLADNQTYRRLDAAGKELKTFKVQVSPNNSIGGVDFLRNGGLVISQTDKVVEYDPNGKIIWQAATRDANCVMRLPNGNTLVASLSGQTLLEFDRTGKEVWRHKGEGPVWMGRRR